MKSHNTDTHQPLEMVISALLYLMTRYSMNPCPDLRQAIVHHLIMLHDHPNTRNADALETTTRRLTNEWLGLKERAAQPVRQRPHQTLQ